MRVPLVIAAAQPHCEAANVAVNARAHAAAVREAQARIVVFPELSLTGYELEAQPVSPTDAALRAIVATCAENDAVALVGAPVEEDGQRFIATLRIDGSGVAVVYRKSHLGGDEVDRFSAGNGAQAMSIDGWRVGMGICKDTGVAEHTRATAELGIDVYVAGLVHSPEQREEQDVRGRRIAATCHSYVAFASFAGPTGGGYDATAGESTIWSPDGSVVARAGRAPGQLARTKLS